MSPRYDFVELFFEKTSARCRDNNDKGVLLWRGKIRQLARESWFIVLMLFMIQIRNQLITFVTRLTSLDWH